MHQVHLLIVEDEPDTSLILAQWASQRGARVVTAGSVAEAETALAVANFDLVLSDVHLPGNDNLQWIEQVLARPDAPAVVLMTGDVDVRSTLRAANLPIAGYLAKPASLPTLEKLLRQVAHDRRLRGELRGLARDAAALATLPDGPGGPGEWREKLQQLSARLAAGAALQPCTARARPASPWATAVADAIAVIEKTKDSFRSKDLGQLRLRLRRLLENEQAA